MHHRPPKVVQSLLIILMLCSVGQLFGQLLPGNARTLGAPVAPTVAGANFGDAIVWADVDHDGRKDLVTIYEDPAEGRFRLVVFRAGPDGFVQQSGSVLLPAGDRIALSACDFDISIPGEEIVIGLPEAVVNVRGLSVEAGQVWTYNMLLPDTPIVIDTYDQSDAPGSTALDNEDFGAAVAAGDFDGDAVCDIAVGSPGEQVDGVTRAGVVHVRWGVGGWSPQFDPRDLTTGAAIDDFDEFGSVLAAGAAGVFLGPSDSGRDVLAIGVPSADVPVDNAGNVWVLRYDSGETPPFEAVMLDPTTVGLPAAPVRLGASLAIGDLNGDRSFDLAIGAPGAEVLPGPVTSGLVVAVPGAADGTVAAALATTVSILEAGETPTAEDDFGASLAIGRFLGGIGRDLVVGAPGADSGSGAISVFRGVTSLTTFDLEPAGTILQEDLPNEDEASDDRFGWAIAAGDSNLDGAPELAVGVPFEDIDSRGLGPGDNQGVVHILPTRSHLRRVEIVAEAGLDFAGQGPIDFIEAPRQNSTGEAVQIMNTAASLDLATTTQQVDASSTELLPRMGIDESGNRAWVDLAEGELWSSASGVLFEDGTAAPVPGLFAFSSDDDLELRGDQQLYFLTELLAPQRRTLLRSDPVAGSHAALIEAGQTIDGESVLDVPRFAASPNSNHWAAQIETGSGSSFVLDGVLLADDRRGSANVIDDLAVSNSGELFYTSRDGAASSGSVLDAAGGTVLSSTADVGSVPLSGMVPRGVSASAGGEVTSSWALGVSGGVLALSCPLPQGSRDRPEPPPAPRGLAPGAGEPVVVLFDALDTTGDGAIDARLVGLDSEPGIVPEVATDGTIVVRALIQRDLAPDEQPLVLLRLKSPVCPRFSDGFESGSTSAWSTTMP